MTLGDPAGVGPEVVLKALRSCRPEPDSARVVVLGDRGTLEYYCGLYGWPATIRELRSVDDADDEPGTIQLLPTSQPIRDLRPGEIRAECGAAAAAALTAGGRLCAAGQLDGLVTAPIHKSALRLAGIHVEGQTELLGELWGGGQYGMLVVADALRVLLLTRHMALRAALDSVSTRSVVEHLELLERTLRRMGITKPRVALAGFNPHAGEGGMFGSEDATLLEPAVARARSLGLDAHGPLPADSLFGRAARGEFDGVLALYHDQGLIPVKAVAFDRAVTVIAGAPHLRVSVIHGAGFDRAGQNRADATNFFAALEIASRLAPLWRARAAGASPITTN